jgi:Xaa-Pro aminopeptidase
MPVASGTGHGVGAYLSVHEGPAGISRAAKPVPLATGMLLSNEPGYYEPGAYGMRLENLVLVQPAPVGAPDRAFLHFETISFAPFDRALIDPAALNPACLAWLNAYHARVLAMLGPHLPDDVRVWLAEQTAPLTK